MSIVKKYKAEVVSIVNPVDNIYVVEMKSGTGKFRYLPGQFLHLAMDQFDPSFGWPESRCFSMQSSPDSDVIKITFSVKGAFTTRMANDLTKGLIIDIKLPYGELFQQEHSKEKVVFIAGGTGITPFLSVFTDPSFCHYTEPKLYLGVRNLNFNIYEHEFFKALKINPSLKIQIVEQDKEGPLDIDKIFQENTIDTTFFISGPQLMISKFKSRLISLGSNESLVKTDEWE